MTRLKHLIEKNESGVWGDDPDGEFDTTVLRSTDIALDGTWVITEPAIRKIAEPERTQKQLATGDLVVVKSSGSPVHLGKTGLVTPLIAAMNPCFANFVQRLRPARNAVPRYVWYLLNSSFASSHLEQLGTTSTGLRNLNGDALGELDVPVTDAVEQREIAGFLDAETARIDALIEKKRRMAAVVGDRRRRTIDDLVGAGQATRRVRHAVSRLTSGPRGWAGFVSEQGSLFLRIANVRRDDIRLDMSNALRVDPPVGAEAERTRVRAGDVVMSITADIGSVGLTDVPHEGAYVSQHLALLSPIACSGEWLAYALSTSTVKSQLDAARYGGTKTQLALEDVADVVVSVPSSSEQDRVLNRLRIMTDAARAAEAALAAQIDLLREHREALVTAAVTGQLDVAKAAA